MHWCSEEEFFCCTGHARWIVKAGRELQLQRQLVRDLSPMCTRRGVVVEVDVMLLLLAGVLAGVLDVVRGSARIRYLFEVDSVLVRMGKMVEERRAWTMLKMAKHWEQVGAAEDHSVA